MRRLVVAGVAFWMLTLAGPSRAQQPSNTELLRRIEALQRRVDELEGRGPPARPVARRKAATANAAPAARPRPAVAAAATPPPAAVPPAAASSVADTDIPGLLPPEPMGRQYSDEDALRSDLPGLSIRIPRADSQVRLYGFAKLSGYKDFDGRNQTDTPPPSGIPLNGSAAARQGGDFGMTARFSRLGVDTRTLTSWGTLETRLEGDFGGGTATSSTATFRLRQAWAELGTESLRVLAGQANSLWNEGVFETLIDATNLNQSFVRQAQVRLTGRLAPGLLGQVSIEAPDTQYTAASGIQTPDRRLDGGASPAFNAAPDILGRLTYQRSGVEIGTRAALRQLSLRTSGTEARPQDVSADTLGWGLAVHTRVPMRLFADAFGPDELLGMVYYGQGIGRYFAGNTFGQDAVSNIGLGGISHVTLDALASYGVVGGYRRFWSPKLRSNLSYAYARQDYPAYAHAFAPGSPAALSLNRDLQQVVVNLIWSPFAVMRDGAVGSSWLDVGIEYLFTRRDVFGGAAATGSAGAGHGSANRAVAAAIARF